MPFSCAEQRYVGSLEQTKRFLVVDIFGSG
jgi:hypothetical protein